MPGLMEGIAKNLKEDVETKLNIMHMTYLSIGCCSKWKPSIGLEVFNELCSQYFEGSRVCVYIVLQNLEIYTISTLHYTILEWQKVCAKINIA